MHKQRQNPQNIVKNLPDSPRLNGIEGTCMDMCPLKERLLREREGLLHRFECLEDFVLEESSKSSWPVEQSTNIGVTSTNFRNQTRGGRRQQAGGIQNRNPGFSRKPLPKADPNKVIKSFARSAAGQDKTFPEDLRPINVLKKTVAYLCSKILIRTDHPFNVVYDFMFDRLRAVRQDLVIQRIEDIGAIIILETIVKFHIYSQFRMQDQPISIYDPHINHKHLVDCLRKLLSLYRVNDYMDSSRTEFEALNCLVFPASYDMIAKAISLNVNIKSKVLEIGIDMALAYQSHNYVRFFRRISELPCLLQIYCIEHVFVMRSIAYHVMCVAYGVNTCKIPISIIASQLLYHNESSVHRDLSLINVEVIKDNSGYKFAKFLKGNLLILKTKLEAGHMGNDINFPSIEALNADKSYFTVPKLVCSWYTSYS